MYKELKNVYDWQKLFGRMGHFVSNNPRSVSKGLAKIRCEFLIEEMFEYLEANENANVVEILDALCDLQYFLFGMVVIHGLQDKFVEAFNIVHESNMSKLGEDGKPIFREDGKIQKGPNYWSPTQKLLSLFQESSYKQDNFLDIVDDK